MESTETMTRETREETLAREERSVAELLRELRDETSHLFQQEVALAKTEMSEKVSRVGRSTGSLAAGGLIAFAGSIFILLALSMLVTWGLAAAGVAGVIAWWLGPLIVGTVVALIGYGLVQSALNTFRRERAMPEETVESLKENGRWLRKRARR